MLEGSHTKVKGGNKVVFSSGNAFSVAKLNKAEKKNVDPFEGWSKERAETVAQANRKIKGRDLSLLQASLNDRWSSGFSGRFGGMWVYNPSLAATPSCRFIPDGVPLTEVPTQVPSTAAISVGNGNAGPTFPEREVPIGPSADDERANPPVPPVIPLQPARRMRCLRGPQVR